MLKKKLSFRIFYTNRLYFTFRICHTKKFNNVQTLYALKFDYVSIFQASKFKKFVELWTSFISRVYEWKYCTEALPQTACFRVASILYPSFLSQTFTQSHSRVKRCRLFQGNLQTNVSLVCKLDIQSRHFARASFVTLVVSQHRSSSFFI